MQSEGGAIAVPSAPTGVSAVGISQTSARVDWGYTASATGYDVYRAPTSGGSFTLVGSNVQALTYTDSGLTAGTAYYYKVKAKNATGDSSFSSEVSATTFSVVEAVPTMGRANYWDINLGRGASTRDLKIEITTGTYSFKLKRGDIRGLVND